MVGISAALAILNDLQRQREELRRVDHKIVQERVGLGTGKCALYKKKISYNKATCLAYKEKV